MYFYLVGYLLFFLSIPVVIIIILSEILKYITTKEKEKKKKSAKILVYLGIYVLIVTMCIIYISYKAEVPQGL